MEHEGITKFKEFIKEYILNKIELQEGNTLYLCDLAGYLYEDDNMDGVIWQGGHEYTTRAREWLRENEDELIATSGYWRCHCGDDDNLLLYSYAEPCKAMCRVVFAYVDAVINGYYSNDEKWTDKWNEEVKITKKFINHLKRELHKGDIIDNAYSNMDYYYDEAVNYRRRGA